MIKTIERIEEVMDFAWEFLERNLQNIPSRFTE